MGLHIGKGLRRLLRQKGLGVLGKLQAILFHDGHCLRAGGTVRVSGAGGDHIQRVAQNIGQNDGKHLRRQAALGKPAALHSRKTLAQRVHFHDVRTAGQQLLCNVRHFFRRDQGAFKQRRTAAGQQEQHRVVFRQAADQLEGAGGRTVGIFIRDRVSGLEKLQRADCALYMVVFCNDRAAADVGTQNVVGGFRHLPRGLTGGDQNETSGRSAKVLQCAAHRGIRHCVGKRTVYDGLRILS